MSHEITVTDLRKQYGSLEAVKGVSLEIPSGQIYGLLGPNGAGKTSLIKMLVTLSQPTGGSATVCGHDVARDPDRVRRVIGYVPQEVSVDRAMTAREHLELFAHLYHLDQAVIPARVNEVLAMVELEGRADEVAGKYSGGMKKRLDLACGLVHRPKMLFLDEPTLGLDIQTRYRLWEYIRRLKADGVTMILTTHYLEEADALCDRVGIMDHGKLVVEGTPGALKSEMGGEKIRKEAPSLDDVFLKYTGHGLRDE